MEASSGNVFADLGFDNAEEMLQKSRLVVAIAQVMKARNLNQSQTSEIVGVDQPTLSKLLRGRTMNFTLDRLLNMLVRLGQDVEISISPAVQEKGANITVRVSKVA